MIQALTKSKKILITLPHLRKPGGVASYYNAILPHLKNYNIYRLEIGSNDNKIGLINPINDQLRFHNTISKIRPNLVHLNPSLGPKSFFRDGFFVWQCKKKKIPFLVFWRGWDKKFEKTVNHRLLPFFKYTFACASAFIVLASEFKNKLVQWGINSPVYIETTAVEESLLKDTDPLSKWVNDGFLLEDKPLKILFLARLEHNKGAFETLDAIKLLLDKGHNVTLTVAGDGSVYSDLQEYATKLGIEDDKVTFTGYIRGMEKKRTLNEHHVYCFPTTYGEGLPNSVLEAMAFGMPVITTPLGGLADMFLDDKMGFLVKSKRPEEIADKIEKLINNPQKMIEIAKFNATYAREHFMAPKVATRIMSIYQEITG